MLRIYVRYTYRIFSLNVCRCTYTHMHTHTFMYIHTHAHARMYIHTHAHVMFLFLSYGLHVTIFPFGCWVSVVFTYIYTCRNILLWIFILMCMYTHTCMFWFLVCVLYVTVCTSGCWVSFVCDIYVIHTKRYQYDC